METIFFVNAHLLPIWVGHRTQFGPHVLLSNEDFEIIWRFLKCRHCSFRRLYHRLVVRERKTGGIAGPHFHSLTRAIKAVLQGLCLNRRCSAKVIVASSHASLISSTDSTNSNYLTMLKTSVSLQNNFVICPTHGRELFDHLYGTDSDSDISSQEDVQRINGISKYFKGHLFIPKGHSTFFRSSMERDASSDDENDVPNTATAVNEKRTLHVLSLSNQSSFETVHTTIQDYYDNLNVDSCSDSMHLRPIELQRIKEANDKWYSFYGRTDVDLCKNCTPVDDTPKTVHHARFPEQNPVSSVRCMRTWSVALALERRNNIWRTEAIQRIFANYCRLISIGHDPHTASELAERGSDEEDCSSSNEYPPPTVACPNSIPSENTEKAAHKKRRRRRKKKTTTMTTKNCSAPVNQTDSWTVRSNNCSTFSNFYSTTIPCRSGQSAFY